MEKQAHIKKVDNGYIVDTDHYCNSSKVYKGLIEAFDQLFHFFEGSYNLEVFIRKIGKGGEK